MSIPRKGSRTINVDGLQYRWLIRKKASANQYEFEGGQMNVAIECIETEGATLLVETVRPRPEWSSERAVPVTPADVAEWIQIAMADGWCPGKPGPIYRFKERNDGKR
jgi:hypothetical protein